MSDFFLDLGQNPTARKVIKTLGLPVPMPPKLRRAKGPWEERPLEEEKIVFGSGPKGALGKQVATAITAAGAYPHVVGEGNLSVFSEAGEAYGRPAVAFDLEEVPEDFKANALIFDATGIADPSDLRALYDFFHPLIRKLRGCGRLVVLGRSPEGQKTAEAAAAQAALNGFVRSCGKEIGKQGSTSTLLYVDKGAGARLEGVLRWVLSARSAFVTGQPIHVTARSKTSVDPTWVRPLDGKVALLTGAARGIGAATAKVLAGEGAHVVCLDRPEDDELCSQVARSVGGSVLLVDVSQPDAAETIAAELQKRHGGVDIVIHNAGITRDKTLGRMKPEHWDQTLNINLAALARITDALVDGALRDNGRIICLSSVAGIGGNMGQTNYAASKAGVIGFVQQLAGPLAKRGITVNAVAPGFIETRMTAAIPVMIREGARRLCNLGQGGLPQDVGELLTFLSTQSAAGITGSVIRVCGGALIGA